MHDNFQLLVVDRIVLGDFRCTGENGRQEAEVEALLFVDRAIPMVVVALDCIRLYPVRRRSDRGVANTCEKSSAGGECSLARLRAQLDYAFRCGPRSTMGCP